MTVRRTKTVQIEGTSDQVRAAVDAALGTSHRYHNVASDDGHWRASYRPAGWPLVLSTRIDVNIGQTTADETTVTLGTTSQRLIAGDMFGAYPRYLEQLAKAISLASGAADSVA